MKRKEMKQKLFMDGDEFDLKKLDEPKPVEEVKDDDSGETEIIQNSESAEAIRELNKDKTEVDGKMSSIDRNARINKVEKQGYHAFNSLISMDFYPKSALFIIRSGLRYSVSIDGKGRKEAVDIHRGVKDHDSKATFFDKVGGVFAGGKGKE